VNDPSHRHVSTTPIIAFNQHTIGCLCEPIRVAGLRAGISRRDIDSLLMAVSEVATNAIQHGGGAGWMTVRCERDGLSVEVRDHGTGFPGAGFRSTDGGLAVARALCHELSIVSRDDGVTVRMFTSSRLRRTGTAACVPAHVVAQDRHSGPARVADKAF
jgi:anti-sigma regulatory factor (Ser/Thr protein kinase)